MALLLLAWWPALLGMARSWLKNSSYYSHGPLIPLICGWLIWNERSRLRARCTAGSGWGLALLACGVAILYLGILQRTRAIQLYGLCLALAGVATAWFGVPVLRRSWFVFAYMAAFMIPLPGVLLTRLTSGLKLGVTAATFKSLELASIPAVMRGDTINFRGHVAVRVDDVCSGLRSLVALLALAGLVAMLQRTRWKAVTILALSIPIALFGNGVRILILSWLAVRGTPAAPGTWLHDLTGLSVYAVALVVLLALAKLPAARSHREEEPVTTPPQLVAPRPWVLGGVLVCVAVALLSLLMPKQSIFREATNVTAALPRSLAGWTSEPIAVDAAVKNALRSEDYLLARFRREGMDRPVELFVLHSDATDMHPPDGCYRLQGFKEMEKGVATFRTGQGEVEANRAVIELQGYRALVYFWFKIDGQHMLKQDRLKLRLKGLAGDLFLQEGVAISTVRISTPIDDGVPAAEERLARFASEFLGEVMVKLP